jgi:hypothetical protein
MVGMYTVLPSRSQEHTDVQYGVGIATLRTEDGTSQTSVSLPLAA